MSCILPIGSFITTDIVAVLYLVSMHNAERERIIGYIITMATFVVFICVSAYTLIWANGLRYNPVTKTFQQTSVVSVEAQLPNATVVLNGDVIGHKAPLNKRNLLPGRYSLSIDQPGYQSISEVFQLEPGQVKIIDKTVVLLANNPQTIKNATNQTYYDREAYDVGITVVNGAVFDNGTLVTRLSSNPIIFRRINNSYIYQLNNQLRIYLPEGNRDNLVYTLSSADPARINIDSGIWQVVVFDQSGSDNAIIINLIQPAL